MMEILLDANFFLRILVVYNAPPNQRQLSNIQQDQQMNFLVITKKI